MNRILIVSLCFALHACGQFQESPEPERPAETEEAAAAQDPGPDSEQSGPATAADPAPTFEGSRELLLARRALCTQPAAQRDQAIRDVAANGNLDARVRHLLLMTCDMKAHRAAISELLTEIRSSREWPEEHLAFFDLLKESADALKTVETQRYALQMRLEDTIQGITHIEEAIDARRESSPLAEE